MSHARMHAFMQARRILESELQDERAGRAAAEEARAKAEADRSRLQLAQDDLAAQVGETWFGVAVGMGFRRRGREGGATC